MSSSGQYWPAQGLTFDPVTERGLGVIYSEFVDFMKSMNPDVEAILTYEEYTAGLFFIPFW